MGEFLKRLRRKLTVPRGDVSYDVYMKERGKVRPMTERLPVITVAMLDALSAQCPSVRQFTGPKNKGGLAAAPGFGASLSLLSERAHFLIC